MSDEPTPIAAEPPATQGRLVRWFTGSVLGPLVVLAVAGMVSGAGAYALATHNIGNELKELRKDFDAFKAAQEKGDTMRAAARVSDDKVMVRTLTELTVTLKGVKDGMGEVKKEMKDLRKEVKGDLKEMGKKVERLRRDRR